MRLGVLPFGADTGEAQIAAELRERDVDVVVADEPATTGAIAAREAERLQRADCDAVALFIGDGTPPHRVTQAALYLGCPLVVLGPMLPFVEEASAALKEIGVPHHRLSIADGVRNTLYDWVKENEKAARQPGIEAARKLYGQTLSFSGPRFLAAALWSRQFGVTVVRDDSEDAAAADFSAPDGDADFALALHLLRLISAQEPRVLPAPETPVEDDSVSEIVTAAQIILEGTRYVCHARRASSLTDLIKEIPTTNRFAVASGDYIAALRAACESLNLTFDFND